MSCQGESRSSHDSLPQPAVVRLALDGPQTLLVVNPLSSPSQRMVYVTVDTYSLMVPLAPLPSSFCSLSGWV